MKSAYHLIMSLLVILIFTSFTAQESQSKSSYQDENISLKSFKKHPVPIKGRFSAILASTGPGSHPIYIQGTGNASHLGKTKFNLGNTFDFSSGIPPFPAKGDIVFTAANGDQLKGKFTGTMTPTGSTSSSISFTGSFIGGTGRFTGAGGGFTWSGTFDMSTQSGIGRLSGTVIY